jgi:4-alpha-glucanotransferase
LGLKICRWARDWNAPGQPYFRVAEYPELSVCTPSVHDTSTLRQWWDEEKDHSGFLGALGLDASADGPYTPERALRILSALMTARSRLCIVPLQDWFALDEGLRTEDPAAERVNTPGTVGGANWAWRMTPSLEDLATRSVFTAQVRGLADQRSRR